MSTRSQLAPEELRRLLVRVTGAVQGVGFRPFVYGLAITHHLVGFVENSTEGASFAIEGSPSSIHAFLRDFDEKLPPLAHVTTRTMETLPPLREASFTIKESTRCGVIQATILPDAATCPECLRELFDPRSRWYEYPFISCTHCGPRATIITGLPYDRARTSMARFPMCPECEKEYRDPTNRRYHAQPIACPHCGPQLTFITRDKNRASERNDALADASTAIQNGLIVAIKGLGGFHLVVDATNKSAVARLRERKHREEKPFAMMYPNLECIKAHCLVSPEEERILTSPQAPIVLLARKPKGEESKREYLPCEEVVGPMNPTLGIMLPYTPLHHLVLKKIGRPIVATSGNISDEPVLTDEDDAMKRLQHIADCFLIHNRPIVRHMDDSIVRVLKDGPLLLRRARGYAPFPVSMKNDGKSILAVGPHQKNTVGVATGSIGVISQHIGDLNTEATEDAFMRSINDLTVIYGVTPEVVACDKHPDYLSTQWAEESGFPRIMVQHHEAHILAVAAEHALSGSYLGVAFDGTGYGHDGTIWGGEWFMATDTSLTRIAHLRQFRLPGGDRSAREPFRPALGLLWEIYGEHINQICADLPPLQAAGNAREVYISMISKGEHAPQTSSAGRLFDAVASILGVRHYCSFEGQAAMELEWHALRATEQGRCDLPEFVRSKNKDGTFMLDWEKFITGLCEGVQKGIPIPDLAWAFHESLARTILEVAREVGEERVLLSGGCFQNTLLLTRTMSLLREAGFTPYRPIRLPPNDGGVTLGQLEFIKRYTN